MPNLSDAIKFAGSYSRYMRNEPLNEDLAAVRDGRDAPVTTPTLPTPEIPAEALDHEKPLTKAERDFLRELRDSGGWYVLVRVLTKAQHRKRTSATLASETNPLDPTNAQLWSEVAMFGNLVKLLPVLIENELVKGDEEK